MFVFTLFPDKVAKKPFLLCQESEVSILSTKKLREARQKPNQEPTGWTELSCAAFRAFTVVFLSQIKTFVFSCVTLTKNIVATAKLVSVFGNKAELGTTYCSTKGLTTQSLDQVTSFYEAGGFLENTKTAKCNFHSYLKGKMVPLSTLHFVFPNHVGSYCWAIVQLMKFLLPQSTKGS